jgi:hypothetical protein
MTNQDFTNLLIAHNLIFKIIKFVQKVSTGFLYQQKVTKEEFNKIFEDIEIPLCRTADDIAIVINQELLNPVTGYKEEIELACNKVQNALANSETYHRLIILSEELVKFFPNIISVKGAYPESSKILNEIKSICNQY